MKFISSLYLSYRLFIATLICIGIFICAFGLDSSAVFAAGKVALLIVFGIFLIDILLLYSIKNGIKGERICADKFSNGDNNPVRIILKNHYGMATTLMFIDEAPEEFQERDLSYEIKLQPQQEEELIYDLRPINRGEYTFHNLNIYAHSFIGFIKRRYTIDAKKTVRVYPSFIELKKYQILALSDRLQEVGVKKVRKVGQDMEFDKIREYVIGDNYRDINWKASARKSQLMVNQYQDEKAQHIYCVIDKGRSMKMPFNGMSLVDYAINSSLVMSNLSLLQYDKPGLITFSNVIGSIVKAANKRGQMNLIMENLYNQTTRHQESDFGRLYKNIKFSITTRSLLMLYTNFESLISLRRQMKYLRAIAKEHMLVVILFENTGVQDMILSEAKSVEDIYKSTIAEKFSYEKKLIVKELQKHGIQAILTTPDNLTVNSINKYLEIKAKRSI